MGRAKLVFPEKKKFEDETLWQSLKSIFEEKGQSDKEHRPYWSATLSRVVEDGKNWVFGKGTLFHVTKSVGHRHLKKLAKKKFVTRKEYNKLLRVFGRNKEGHNNFPQVLRYGRK